MIEEEKHSSQVKHLMRLPIPFKVRKVLVNNFNAILFGGILRPIEQISVPVYRSV